tara:strand:- start:319 stop:534 length:216 start_codon:yes stop_codon:yes gene_type:complete
VGKTKPGNAKIPVTHKLIKNPRKKDSPRLNFSGPNTTICLTVVKEKYRRNNAIKIKRACLIIFINTVILAS